MTLWEMQNRLLAVPPEVWNWYALAREPLKNKIPPEELDGYFSLARETGRGMADRVKREFPGKSLEEIYRSLSIRLNRLEECDGGGYTLFACYTEPDQVELYQGGIRNLEEARREEGCPPLPGSARIEDILLAHELFHFYECHEEGGLPTGQKLLTLWRIGRFCRKSRLVFLSELAAMEFAREYLELTYSPYVLDVLLVYPSDPALAHQIYREIVTVHGLLCKQ